jgi:hypothetical protein
MLIAGRLWQYAVAEINILRVYKVEHLLVHLLHISYGQDACNVANLPASRHGEAMENVAAVPPKVLVFEGQPEQWQVM